jgi:hypothetical protein
MQTDPNFANFLYDSSSGIIVWPFYSLSLLQVLTLLVSQSLLDFGACRTFDPVFVDAYLDVSLTRFWFYVGNLNGGSRC